MGLVERNALSYSIESFKEYNRILCDLTSKQNTTIKAWKLGSELSSILPNQREFYNITSNLAKIIPLEESNVNVPLCLQTAFPKSELNGKKIFFFLLRQQQSLPSEIKYRGIKYEMHDIVEELKKYFSSGTVFILRVGEKSASQETKTVDNFTVNISLCKPENCIDQIQFILKQLLDLRKLIIANIPLKDGRTRARTTLTLDFFVCINSCKNHILEPDDNNLSKKSETNNTDMEIENELMKTTWKKTIVDLSTINVTQLFLISPVAPTNTYKTMKRYVEKKKLSTILSVDGKTMYALVHTTLAPI